MGKVEGKVVEDVALCPKAELIATIPPPEILRECARQCQRRNLGGTASALRLMAMRIAVAQERSEEKPACHRGHDG